MKQLKPQRQDTNVRLYEERLVTGKRRVKTGEVALKKHIETETASVSIPLEKERIVIERSTPDRETATILAEDAFHAGQVARIEVYEEMPEIHKEAFVHEEVEIKKQVEQDVVTAEAQLRHEELDITIKGHPVTEAK